MCQRNSAFCLLATQGPGVGCPAWNQRCVGARWLHARVFREYARVCLASRMCALKFASGSCWFRGIELYSLGSLDVVGVLPS